MGPVLVPQGVAQYLGEVLYVLVPHDVEASGLLGAQRLDLNAQILFEEAPRALLLSYARARM
jgi:hypothetical protein